MCVEPPPHSTPSSFTLLSPPAISDLDLPISLSRFHVHSYFLNPFLLLSPSLLISFNFLFFRMLSSLSISLFFFLLSLLLSFSLSTYLLHYVSRNRQIFRFNVSTVIIILCFSYSFIDSFIHFLPPLSYLLPSFYFNTPSPLSLLYTLPTKV